MDLRVVQSLLSSVFFSAVIATAVWSRYVSRRYVLSRCVSNFRALCEERIGLIWAKFVRGTISSESLKSARLSWRESNDIDPSRLTLYLRTEIVLFLLRRILLVSF